MSENKFTNWFADWGGRPPKWRPEFPGGWNAKFLLERASNWIRRLNEEELRVARQVFGFDLDTNPIRIVKAPVPNAFVFLNYIVFPQKYFRRGKFDLGGKLALLVHELTHIYQWQQRDESLNSEGNWYFSALVRRIIQEFHPRVNTKDIYSLEEAGHLSWSELGLEQQAEVVEEYYRRMICHQRGQDWHARVSNQRIVEWFVESGIGGSWAGRVYPLRETRESWEKPGPRQA